MNHLKIYLNDGSQILEMGGYLGWSGRWLNEG